MKTPKEDYWAPDRVAFLFALTVASLATFISVFFTFGYGLYAEPVGVIALPILAMAELFKIVIPFWASALWEDKAYRWARVVGAIWMIPAFACGVAYSNAVNREVPYLHVGGGSGIESKEAELRRLRNHRPLTEIQEDMRRAESEEEAQDLKAEADRARRAVDLQLEIGELKYKAKTEVKEEVKTEPSNVGLLLTLNAVQLVGFLSLLAVSWTRPRPPAPPVSSPAPLSPQGGGSAPQGPSAPPAPMVGGSPFVASPITPPATQLYVPVAPSVVRKMPAGPDRYGFRLGQDITPQARTWFWPDVLRSGRLAMLAGEGGVGKSTIAAFIAAASGRGGVWPTGEPIAPGGVILCETEDDPDEDTTPRLMAAGADMSRVIVTDKRFDLANDLNGIIQAGKSLKNNCGLDPKLLVLSPVKTFFGNKESYNDAEVRARLEKILRYAAANSICVLGIAHLTKDKKSMGGSQAWVNVARCGLKAEWIDGVGGTRQVTPLKANSGSVGWAIPFDTEGLVVDGCPTEVITWGEKTYSARSARFDRSEGEAEEVESTDVEERPRPQMQVPRRPGRDDTELQKAMAFIARVMAQGMRMGNEIVAKSEEEGISRGTLDRAAEKLGIIKTDAGKTVEWGWAS